MGDEEGGGHDFQQRFHFDPEIDVSRAGDGLRLEWAGSGDPLHVVPLAPAPVLAPIRGCEEPELLGWVSDHEREMRPCWTSGFHAADVAAFGFQTLLAFGLDAPVSLAEAGPQDSQLPKFALRWRQGDRIQQVDVSWPERDAPAVAVAEK